MLASAPVMCFVPCTDLDRSHRFYAEVLGLTVEEATPFACVLRVGKGKTMVRLTLVDDFDPQDFTVLGWSVADIRQAVRELAERGVEFTTYDGMGQDSDGVWKAPNGDAVAWFTDPDGNTLSISQLTQH